MVDVAAIFDEVFGHGDQDQAPPEKKCVSCVSVSGCRKPLGKHDTPNTKIDDTKHIFEKSVSENSEKCVQDIVEKQEVTDSKHKNTKTQFKMDAPSEPVDADAFEERSAIIEYDGGLPRQEAEALAAQEQGFADTDSLHGELVRRWAAEIERLATLPAVSPDGAEALKRAQAFISEGWALQAARLGWGEVELFGVCPRAPWRLGGQGAAFGGAVQAITQEMVAYVGGLRRYRAIINNDGGAVLIWEHAQSNPSSGGNAA